MFMGSVAVSLFACDEAQNADVGDYSFGPGVRIDVHCWQFYMTSLFGSYIHVA